MEEEEVFIKLVLEEMEELEVEEILEHQLVLQEHQILVVVVVVVIMDLVVLQQGQMEVQEL